jgi:type IV secretory pathway VirB10-like protein
MCPEPALLVAYLDGTLFRRDADAVDAHVETCASCSDLLAAMRRHRQDEERSRRARIVRRTAIAIAAVALLVIGMWAALTRSRTAASSPTIEPEQTEPRAAASISPPKPVEQVSPPPPKAAVPTPARPSLPPSPSTTRPVTARNANTRTARRAHDRVIEHSTDGGATWVAEQTADRNIRAGAFVSADVAWVVGDSGLVLRRTKNGWFGASAPANVNITAVRASSPSKATVTLEDGRVFTTENGGVTWSPK